MIQKLIKIKTIKSIFWYTEVISPRFQERKIIFVKDLGISANPRNPWNQQEVGYITFLKIYDKVSVNTIDRDHRDSREFDSCGKTNFSGKL